MPTLVIVSLFGFVLIAEGNFKHEKEAKIIFLEEVI